MLIHDRIYGTFDILDPVLIELIHTPPVQRLKRINQSGASKYVFLWKDVTRFDHSIGVMLLLRKFGADLVEQVAGLLHDIPHTAFSHVADFVFANKHHTYHEQFHESMIENSEIAQILNKYKIPKTVAHPEQFGLLERNIPDLCADRIDYTLRDHFSLHKDRESIEAKLAGLVVYKGEFVFSHAAAAESFAKDYLEFDRNNWADPREVALYELLAQAIRHALDQKILTVIDLFTDDETVLSILKTHGDPFVLKKLAFLTPAFRIEEATREHYHLHIKTKHRYVDPKVLQGKTIQRLSAISTRYNKMLKKHLQHGASGWYIHVFRS